MGYRQGKDSSVNSKFLLRFFAITNAGLGLVHAFFGVASPVNEGLSHEGYFFLVIALLFFVVTTGFVLKNRWVVVLSSVPLVLIGCMFTFLMLGGAWIWGPPRSGQTYLLCLGSLLVATLEITGIFSIFRYSKKEQSADGSPQP